MVMPQQLSGAVVRLKLAGAPLATASALEIVTVWLLLDMRASQCTSRVPP